MRNTFLPLLLFIINLAPAYSMTQEAIQTDAAEVEEPDSVSVKYSFPIISVGTVSFLDGTEVIQIDTVLVEQPDSAFFQKLSKKGITDFFIRNVVYPSELKQKEAEAYMKVRFDVDRRGQVKNPKVVDATYPEMEQEVLRVVGKLPDYAANSVKKSKKDPEKNKKDRAKNITVEVPISFRLLKL